MFDMPNMKPFKDSVHGYINIPAVFVSNIIDTPEFQRLRNIEQTGMKVLYPTAKHDRFSHSLGVFHLGSIAVDALMENFRSDRHWKIRSDNTREVFWAKNKVLFLIACLLHDIGHAPFSHSLERFFDFGDNETNKNNRYLNLRCMLLGSNCDSAEESYFRKSAEHEKMSAWLVIDSNSPWRGRIKNVLEELGNDENKFPESFEEHDGEYDEPPPYINANELEEDVNFIARMILGVKYSDYRPEKQIRNCFIELLNGHFDVDKLDYTVRDTKMSGISNISLDIERLLNAITIIPKTVYVNTNINLQESDEVIITGLVCRNKERNETHSLKIKAQLNGPLFINNGEVICSADTGIILQPISKQRKGIFTSGGAVNPNRGLTVGKEPVVISDDIQFKPIDNKLSIRSCSNKDTPMCLELNVYTNEEIKFVITQQYWLYINNEFADNETIINGDFSLNQNSSISFRGTMEGYVDYLEVLSDKKGDVPTENIYTGYSLGFKKQAVNLISNVTDARNYLYLWIYSHHKVIYYANYLIVELARCAVPYIINDQILSEEMFKTLIGKNDNIQPYMLDEDYINYQMREAFRKCSNVKYKELFIEYASRKYHNSLYKSLVEFDLLFANFNDDEKKNMKKRLEDISSVFDETDLSHLLDESPQKRLIMTKLKYGIVRFDFLSKMSSGDIKLSDIIEDLVWVASKPSLKRPPLSNILISFSDKISTMDRLPLLKVGSLKEEQDYYFYLYYKIKNNEDVKKCGLKTMREIRDVISKSFVSFMKGELRNHSD